MEPMQVASPMGKSVSGYISDARYASGMRAHKAEMRLCAKEMMAYPQAVRYPLKQKCMPAKTQSHT